MQITLNYQGLFEIDTNYGGIANWVPLKKGISNITPANNDVVSQKSYMDGEGYGSSKVTGMQATLSVTGDRYLGDDAQDYIFDAQYELGDGRTTQCRVTDPNGVRKTGECTICNITPPGGDASTEQTFSFEIHFNGKPSLVPASVASDLAITVAAGTTKGTTTITASADVDNTLGYTLTVGEASTPNAYSYVSVTSFTSGDELAAAEGQYLNVYEIDENKRVIKFASQVLASGDIGA